MFAAYRIMTAYSPSYQKFVYLIKSTFFILDIGEFALVIPYMSYNLLMSLECIALCMFIKFLVCQTIDFTSA